MNCLLSMRMFGIPNLHGMCNPARIFSYFYSLVQLLIVAAE